MFRKKMTDRLHGKRGQQIMEHIIMVTAVVVVIIYFMRPGGVFRSVLDKVMSSPEAMIVDQTKSDLVY